MFDAHPIGIESGERAAGQVPVARSATRKPVLIVLHQENSNPGHVGQWLVRNGFRLDIRKPRFGEPLPETLADHCGAVIFGGPMSANIGSAAANAGASDAKAASVCSNVAMACAAVATMASRVCTAGSASV
jgi:hypothetical protein